MNTYETVGTVCFVFFEELVVDFETGLKQMFKLSNFFYFPFMVGIIVL